MAYDPFSMQMMLFGGNGGSLLNDTWLLNGSVSYISNYSKNWTNGTLMTLTIPTNITFNASLFSLNDTQNVSITLFHGLINDSYLLAAIADNRTRLNVTELIELNIFDSSFIFNSTANVSTGINITNMTLNASFFQGGVLNITNLSTNGFINSSFFIINDTTNYSFYRLYDGIYLPIGRWEIEIRELDTSGRNISTFAYINSARAIQQSLVAGNTTAIINSSSNATLFFDVKSKQYPFVRYYMNLTDNAISNYDVTFANIGNETDTVNISYTADYAGAELYSLNTTLTANVPDYIYYIDGLYNDLVRLYINPYEGLSAGVYTGTYGWGLDDGS